MYCETTTGFIQTWKHHFAGLSTTEESKIAGFPRIKILCFRIKRIFLRTLFTWPIKSADTISEHGWRYHFIQQRLGAINALVVSEQVALIRDVQMLEFWVRIRREASASSAVTASNSAECYVVDKPTKHKNGVVLSVSCLTRPMYYCIQWKSEKSMLTYFVPCCTNTFDAKRTIFFHPIFRKSPCPHGHQKLCPQNAWGHPSKSALS